MPIRTYVNNLSTHIRTH